MTFKVGDRVRLPSVKPVDADTGPGWSILMDSLLGQSGEVERVTGYGWCKVRGFSWLPHWLTIDRAEAKSEEIPDWAETERRMKSRRDANLRSVFGG